MKQELLKSVIYQVFVRNETKEGTFSALNNKLEEIKEKGADILYLMPISPIGKDGKKGTLGSPYAIEDYEAFNPEYGTEEDFIELVKKAHSLDMKVMMDIVFNHTSRDARLIKEHSEYYHHDKDGKMGNKIGEWSDVYDLETSRDDVQDYLVSVLVKYKSYGVDGFRFDVASFLPSTFYKKARKALGDEMIFLAEAVDGPFLLYAREKGIHAISNEELFASGFDLCYHYFNWHYLSEFLENRSDLSLSCYKASLEGEQAGINEDGLIVRAIENHDRPRIASYSEHDSFTRSLLAYSFFTRGPAFVYSGEESKVMHMPSLFDKDTVDFSSFDKEYYLFYLKNVELKKREKNKKLILSSCYQNKEKGLVIKNIYQDDKDELGIFPLDDKPVIFHLDIKDGIYENLLGGKVTVKGSSLETEEPIILVL